MRIAALIALVCLGCHKPIARAPEPPSSSAPRQRPPSSISGIVRFRGLPTHEKPPRINNPIIDWEKAKSLRVGADGALANVFVTIESGLSGPHPITKEPAQIDMVGYLFEPRVLGMMKDQILIARNGDPSAQNFHGHPKSNPEFNWGLSGVGVKATIKFPNPERGIKVQSDACPWMVAWIHVTEHPYFSVTGIDGRYSIENLPPGEYEVLAWHERFRSAPVVSKVTVVEGKVATLDFTFEAPPR